MVTIVDYKKYQRENGESFYALEVQGGIESVLIKKPERLTLQREQLRCHAPLTSQPVRHYWELKCPEL